MSGLILFDYLLLARKINSLIIINFKRNKLFLFFDIEVQHFNHFVGEKCNIYNYRVKFRQEEKKVLIKREKVLRLPIRSFKLRFCNLFIITFMKLNVCYFLAFSESIMYLLYAIRERTMRDYIRNIYWHPPLLRMCQLCYSFKIIDFFLSMQVIGIIYY